MTPTATLEAQAIQAAKTQDWTLAISINKEILESEPENTAAFMRLGVAYAQVDQIPDAKQCFERVLEIDKANMLAKKHLTKLANKQHIAVSALPSDEDFIEEPGKTRTVDLHRLAGKEQLEKVVVGQQCQLKSKNRFISVEIDKTYIGSLPEDLSARLAKLMKTGNEYVCYVQAISPTGCSVFLKESRRSPENQFTHSFPPIRNQLMNEMFMSDDGLPLQLEAVPLQMVETDTDGEETPKFDLEEPMEEVMPDEPEEPRMGGGSNNDSE